ncbi:MAG: DMT family transporter [bacterium]|jgi:drug/metabolite transporter (DMT)-like permease
MRRKWSAELALICNAFIWGSTFVLVKEALSDASVLTFLALRFALATVILGAVFRPLPSKFAAGKELVRGGVLAGLLLFAAYALQTFGLRYTTASKSAFLTGLSIVMVPVFAAAVQRARPVAAEWAGVVAATGGLALLTLDGPIWNVNAGDMLTIGCAAAFAAHILVVGHYVPRFGFQALTLVQVGVSAALSGAVCWWAEPVFIRWTSGLIFALLVTAVLATALAFAVMAWAQQYTSPTRTALILALEPVFAWATAYVVAGEVLSLRAASGALLILGGILLVELKPFGNSKRPGR